jgi:hypothetical protein
MSWATLATWPHYPEGGARVWRPGACGWMRIGRHARGLSVIFAVCLAAQVFLFISFHFSEPPRDASYAKCGQRVHSGLRGGESGRERARKRLTFWHTHAPQMSSAHFWGAISGNAVVRERMVPPQTRSAACGAASRLATQNALLARQGLGGAITSGLTRCPSEHAHARASRGVCRARLEHTVSGQHGRG